MDSAVPDDLQNEADSKDKSDSDSQNEIKKDHEGDSSALSHQKINAENKKFEEERKKKNKELDEIEASQTRFQYLEKLEKTYAENIKFEEERKKKNKNKKLNEIEASQRIQYLEEELKKLARVTEKERKEEVEEFRASEVTKQQRRDDELENRLRILNRQRHDRELERDRDINRQTEARRVQMFDREMEAERTLARQTAIFKFMSSSGIIANENDLNRFEAEGRNIIKQTENLNNAQDFQPFVVTNQQRRKNGQENRFRSQRYYRDEMEYEMGKDGLNNSNGSSFLAMFTKKKPPKETKSNGKQPKEKN